MAPRRMRKREVTGRAEEGEPSCKATVTRSAKRRTIRFEETEDVDEIAATTGVPEQEAHGLIAPPKFHGCFSSKHVSDLISDFEVSKKDCMHNIGLGGLLWLRVGMTYNRRLIFSLLARLDVSGMKIRLGDATLVDLTEESIHTKMSVSSDGEKIDASSDALSVETLKELRHWFSVDEGVPRLEDAKAVVTREWPENVGMRKKMLLQLLWPHCGAGTCLGQGSRLQPSLWTLCMCFVILQMCETVIGQVTYFM